MTMLASDRPSGSLLQRLFRPLSFSPGVPIDRASLLADMPVPIIVREHVRSLEAMFGTVHDATRPDYIRASYLRRIDRILSQYLGLSTRGMEVPALSSRLKSRVKQQRLMKDYRQLKVSWIVYVLLSAIGILTQGTGRASALPTGHALAEKVAAKDALAELARMVGTWRPADKMESPLRIRFYLTAGGTVLVESWEARGQPHSLTLYHRDGETVLATHYCPQGNQPRLALLGRDAGGLHFAFRDATDLDPAKEAHQHDLWLDLTNLDRPVRGETYRSKEGLGTRERLQLVRDSETGTNGLGRLLGGKNGDIEEGEAVRQHFSKTLNVSGPGQR